MTLGILDLLDQDAFIYEGVVVSRLHVIQAVMPNKGRCSVPIPCGGLDPESKQQVAQSLDILLSI